MNATEKLELQVAEGEDGSATVIIDEPVTQDPPEAANKPADDPDGDDGEHADDGPPDADPEREAIRQARREERARKKQAQRDKMLADKREKDMLRRENQELASRIANLEKRTQGADLARLDKAIEDSLLRLEYAKRSVADAVSAGDGNAVAEAQDRWFEARRQAEALNNLKQRAAQSVQRRPAVPQAPDIQLQRQATAWMSRNAWYDPQGRDTDSKVTTQVDQTLTEEGWDPKSPEYWEELDKRLTKYLPHRYNGGTERQKGPRSVVTGSSREASTSGTRPSEFRLSAERVKAIKEAGMWDDPTKRNSMIRKYAEFDRNNRGN